MTNYVDHRLTITGPEEELKRFASCFVKAKEGDLFTQYFIDKHCDGRPLERPVGELYFDFDKLGPAKPEDSDEWVLNRWGIKWVACQGKIEVAPGEIKLAWGSGNGRALQVYAELAELFPLLTMEGDYCEYGFGIAGDVGCHGGKFTHVDKSEEFKAKRDAWEATSAEEHDDQFYADLLRFVADQPNNIKPGTIGEQDAQIAKRLVSEDPTLVSPDRRKELMEKIRTGGKVVVYVEPHDDTALADMMAVIEKRFPQGAKVVARRRR